MSALDPAASLRRPPTMALDGLHFDNVVRTG
jgi:hypothetical protein